MRIIQQGLINLVLPFESLERDRANKCRKIFPHSQGAYIPVIWYPLSYFPQDPPRSGRTLHLSNTKIRNNTMIGTLGFGSDLKCQRKKSTKNRVVTQLKSINEVHANLLTDLEDVPDPRVKRTQKHILKDILTIDILAVIGGAEGWEDIENYGLAKQKWLAEFLELPSGYTSVTIHLDESLNGSTLKS